MLMSHQDDIEYQLDTLAIRTGHTRSFEGEHSEPIFLTSSFVYENAAEAAAKFSGAEPGNIYSRFTNPTVAMFEKRNVCCRCFTALIKPCAASTFCFRNISASFEALL